MTSTTLLMGRMPAWVSRALSQAGEAPTVTPRMTRAPYRAHRSGSAISTAIAMSAGAPLTGGSSTGGGASGSFAAAATSRATP